MATASKALLRGSKGENTGVRLFASCQPGFKTRAPSDACARPSQPDTEHPPAFAPRGGHRKRETYFFGSLFHLDPSFVDLVAPQQSHLFLAVLPHQRVATLTTEHHRVTAEQAQDSALWDEKVLPAQEGVWGTWLGRLPQGPVLPSRGMEAADC